MCRRSQVARPRFALLLEYALVDVERKGKERKGKERKGKERKGKERKGKGGMGGDGDTLAFRSRVWPLSACCRGLLPTLPLLRR